MLTKSSYLSSEKTSGAGPTIAHFLQFLKQGSRLFDFRTSHIIFERRNRRGFLTITKENGHDWVANAGGELLSGHAYNVPPVYSCSILPLQFWFSQTWIAPCRGGNAVVNGTRPIEWYWKFFTINNRCTRLEGGGVYSNLCLILFTISLK